MEARIIVVEPKLSSRYTFDLTVWEQKFNRDHVGCWNDAAQWRADTRGLPPPSVVLVTGEVQEAVDAALTVPYQQMFRGLRPGVLISVYVRQDLWDAFLATAAL